MTVRKKVLAVTLAFGLFAVAALGQPPADRPKRDLTAEELQTLQQQLAALSFLKGKTPEEQEQLLEMLGKLKGQDPLKNPDAFRELAEKFNLGKDAKPADLERFKNFFPKGNADQPPPVPPVQFPPPVPPPPPQQRPFQIVPQGPPDPRDRVEAQMDEGNPAVRGPFKLNFQPQFELDPRLQKNPNVAEMAKFWEKNFGPLEKTPAVKDALLELLEMSKDGKFADGDWKNLLEDFNKDGGNADGMADWFKEMNLQGEKWDFDFGKGWDMPKFGGGWGGGNWGGGNNWGGGGGGGGGGGSFGGGGGGSWLPVILLVVIAVAGLIAWKLWPMLRDRNAVATPGVGALALGRWPVDPRRISTREELVKAFEYLSVLLCGDAARVWNHETIARALRVRIPASEMIADELAKLYELARYTPPGEPLSPAALADARRCLCHLAGVPA